MKEIVEEKRWGQCEQMDKRDGEQKKQAKRRKRAEGSESESRGAKKAKGNVAGAAEAVDARESCENGRELRRSAGAFGLIAFPQQRLLVSCWPLIRIVVLVRVVVVRRPSVRRRRAPRTYGGCVERGRGAVDVEVHVAHVRVVEPLHGHADDHLHHAHADSAVAVATVHAESERLRGRIVAWPTAHEERCHGVRPAAARTTDRHLAHVRARRGRQAQHTVAA